jgi:hypothetical protein
MTKLKTLKDLEYPEFYFFLIDGEEFTTNMNTVNTTILRAEAIRWIKELERSKIGEKNIMIGYGITTQIKWIRDFFNITEDDLK